MIQDFKHTECYNIIYKFYIDMNMFLKSSNNIVFENVIKCFKYILHEQKLLRLILIYINYNVTL